jgi:hypothetical protein
MDASDHGDSFPFAAWLSGSYVGAISAAANLGWWRCARPESDRTRGAVNRFLPSWARLDALPERAETGTLKPVCFASLQIAQGGMFASPAF